MRSGHPWQALSESACFFDTAWWAGASLAGNTTLLATDMLSCRNSTSKPAVIRALEHTNIVQVAAGGWHCLAVSQEGKMYAWGGNEYFQCGVDAGAFFADGWCLHMQLMSLWFRTA